MHNCEMKHRIDLNTPKTNFKKIMAELLSNNYSEEQFSVICNNINEKLKYTSIKQFPLHKHRKDEIFLGNYIMNTESKKTVEFCDLSINIYGNLIVFLCRGNNEESTYKICLRHLFLEDPKRFDSVFEHCEYLTKKFINRLIIA